MTVVSPRVNAKPLTSPMEKYQSSAAARNDTVSFIAAAVLYKFAISDVQNFAFTLGLTTLVDVIVVFLFTKPMITLLARTTFFGQGHRWSGLDPARLGARTPWRSSRPARVTTTTTTATATPPKEA